MEDEKLILIKESDKKAVLDALSNIVQEIEACAESFTVTVQALQIQMKRETEQFKAAINDSSNRLDSAVESLNQLLCPDESV